MHHTMAHPQQLCAVEVMIDPVEHPAEQRLMGQRGAIGPATFGKDRAAGIVRDHVRRRADLLDPARHRPVRFTLAGRE